MEYQTKMIGMMGNLQRISDQHYLKRKELGKCVALLLRRILREHGLWSEDTEHTSFQAILLALAYSVDDTLLDKLLIQNDKEILEAFADLKKEKSSES